MHVTFDPLDIEETMPQQARKQLETELEMPFIALVTFAVCIQLFWSVQSSPESRVPSNMHGNMLKQQNEHQATSCLYIY